MAHYVVGDVQGCLAPLQCLLDRAAFDPARDRLWSVGDLVNRGPDSLGVLRLFHRLGPAARCVLGNHDLHLLAVASGEARARKSDTLDAILQAPDRAALLDWLMRQPLLLNAPEQGVALVHAGIPPQWSLPQAQALAGEVSAALQRDPRRFFRHMYGNEPLRWDDGLRGYARLRAITNYLTRMRFCTEDGELDLATKDERRHPDPRFRPWFEHPGHRALGGVRLLFGHWAALQGDAITDRVLALDTGCVWGNRLRMLRIEDDTLLECDCAPAAPQNTDSTGGNP